MRAVQLADVEAAARALLLVPGDQRAALAHVVCARAQLADRYRKRLRKPHPEYGTGSLMSAAAAYQQACRSARDTRDYIDCIHVVTAALIARRWDQNR